MRNPLLLFLAGLIAWPQRGERDEHLFLYISNALSKRLPVTVVCREHHFGQPGRPRPLATPRPLGLYEALSAPTQASCSHTQHLSHDSYQTLLYQSETGMVYAPSPLAYDPQRGKFRLSRPGISKLASRSLYSADLGRNLCHIICRLGSCQSLGPSRRSPVPCTNSNTRIYINCTLTIGHVVFGGGSILTTEEQSALLSRLSVSLYSSILLCSCLAALLFFWENKKELVPEIPLSHPHHLCLVPELPFYTFQIKPIPTSLSLSQGAVPRHTSSNPSTKVPNLILAHINNLPWSANHQTTHPHTYLRHPQNPPHTPTKWPNSPTP